MSSCRQPHPLWFHSCPLHLAQCCSMNERKNAMMVPLFILALYALLQAILRLWDDFTPSEKLPMTIFSTRTLKIIAIGTFFWEIDCNLLGYNLVTISPGGRFLTSTETKVGPILLQNECEHWWMSANTRKDTKLRDRGLYDSCIFSEPLIYLYI